MPLCVPNSLTNVAWRKNTQLQTATQRGKGRRRAGLFAGGEGRAGIEGSGVDSASASEASACSAIGSEQSDLPGWHVVAPGSRSISDVGVAAMLPAFRD